MPEVESRTQGSRPRPGTQKNFEAQDRPSRGQGTRIKDTDASVLQKKDLQKFFSGDLKKKGVKKYFSGDEGLQKVLFRRSLLEKPKKRSSQILCKVSGVFQRNFNGSKIVLSSSRGQGNYRVLEASRLRPRTSKCVLEDVLNAKDVLEDSTSDKCNPNLCFYPISDRHYTKNVEKSHLTSLKTNPTNQYTKNKQKHTKYYTPSHFNQLSDLSCRQQHCLCLGYSQPYNHILVMLGPTS